MDDGLDLLDGLHLFDRDNFLFGLHSQLLLEALLNIDPFRHLRLLLLVVPILILDVWLSRVHHFLGRIITRILFGLLCRHVLTSVPLFSHLPYLVQSMGLLLVKILIALLNMALLLLLRVMILKFARLQFLNFLYRKSILLIFIVYSLWVAHLVRLNDVAFVQVLAVEVVVLMSRVLNVMFLGRSMYLDALS